MWILTAKEDNMEIDNISAKASNTHTGTGASPVIKREDQFLKNCSSHVMIDKIPDVSNTLLNSEVNLIVRGRLIGWLVEVLENLHKPFSYSELFRAILIMDLYIKHTNEIVLDENLHIIGVTALYLSSKYETNSHLSATELTQVACHGKFTDSEIFEFEFKIVKTLGFNVGYPTHYDVLRLFLSQQFDTDNPAFKTFEMLATNFLLFVLMEVHFNNYLMDELVIAIILTSVRYYYKCKLVKLKYVFNFKNTEKMLEKEKSIIHQLLATRDRPNDTDSISRFVEKYLRTFKMRYEECHYVTKLFDFNEDIMGK